MFIRRERRSEFLLAELDVSDGSIKARGHESVALAPPADVDDALLKAVAHDGQRLGLASGPDGHLVVLRADGDDREVLPCALRTLARINRRRKSHRHDRLLVPDQVELRLEVGAIEHGRCVRRLLVGVRAHERIPVRRPVQPPEEARAGALLESAPDALGRRPIFRLPHDHALVIALRREVRSDRVPAHALHQAGVPLQRRHKRALAIPHAHRVVDRARRQQRVVRRPGQVGHVGSVAAQSTHDPPVLYAALALGRAEARSSTTRAECVYKAALVVGAAGQEAPRVRPAHHVHAAHV